MLSRQRRHCFWASNHEEICTTSKRRVRRGSRSPRLRAQVPRCLRTPVQLHHQEHCTRRLRQTSHHGPCKHRPRLLPPTPSQTSGLRGRLGVKPWTWGTVAEHGARAVGWDGRSRGCGWRNWRRTCTKTFCGESRGSEAKGDPWRIPEPSLQIPRIVQVRGLQTLASRTTRTVSSVFRTPWNSRKQGERQKQR